MSFDHKPENPIETKRTQAGGGFIEDGRVMGVIAVSRALGDWEYKNPGLLPKMEKSGSIKKRKSAKVPDTEVKKGPYRDIPVSKKHMVTAFPDIVVEPITDKIAFLIVACDGIWDCYTNEEAIKYVNRKKRDGPRVSKKAGMSPTKVRSGKAGLVGYHKSGSPLKVGRKM